MGEVGLGGGLEDEHGGEVEMVEVVEGEQVTLVTTDHTLSQTDSGQTSENTTTGQQVHHKSLVSPDQSGQGGGLHLAEDAVVKGDLCKAGPSQQLHMSAG